MMHILDTILEYMLIRIHILIFLLDCFASPHNLEESDRDVSVVIMSRRNVHRTGQKAWHIQSALTLFPAIAASFRSCGSRLRAP